MKPTTRGQHPGQRMRRAQQIGVLALIVVMLGMYVTFSHVHDDGEETPHTEVVGRRTEKKSTPIIHPRRVFKSDNEEMMKKEGKDRDPLDVVVEGDDRRHGPEDPEQAVLMKKETKESTAKALFDPNRQTDEIDTTTTEGTNTHHRDDDDDKTEIGKKKKGGSVAPLAGGGGGVRLPTDITDELPSRIVFTTVQTGATMNWCRMLLSGAMSTWSNKTLLQQQNLGHEEGGGRGERGREIVKSWRQEEDSAGIVVHNIGWGQKYAHKKRPAWILKWISSLKKKQQLSDEDIIFFNDGSDAVFTGVDGYRDVVAKFLAHEKRSGTSIFFNAEANCFHQQTFHASRGNKDARWGTKKGKCISAYHRFNPYLTEKWRYLNGGGWIGRVAAVEIIMSAAKARFDKDSSLWCDQSVFGGLYLSNQFHPLLGLDYLNEVFLPVYNLKMNKDFCSSSSESSSLDPAEDLVDREGGGNGSSGPPRVKMCHSGELPALLHLNGKVEKELNVPELLRRTTWMPEVQKVRKKIGGPSPSTVKPFLSELHLSDAKTVLSKDLGNSAEEVVSLASVCGKGFGV